MAKEKKSKLQEARENLKEAQKTYGQMVRKSTGRMTSEPRAEHLQACRKALADKRYAAGVAEALANGRQPPKREDVREADSG